MSTTRPFRFGVNMIVPGSRADWVDKCRKAEALGFDVIAVPDHLGLHAPLPALVLAAEATERVRLNTFVLNAAFYNPTLIARDIATTDQFTAGRLELGLGAGYVRAEFDAAGIPFPSAGRRVDHVERTVHELRRLFADPEHLPRPVQPSGPPLLIAGWGDRLLRLAAEHADVIAFTGGAAGDGRPTLADAESTQGRVDYVRSLLGARSAEVEFNILIQRMEPSRRRAAVAAEIAAYLPPGSSGDLDEIPTLLIGTPEEMAATLRERRDRFGFSYVTVLEPNMDALADVIPLLRM